MRLEDFPFTTEFISEAQIVTPQEDDKYLAKASFDNWSKVFADKQIDPEENPDLLYVAGEAFVPNLANRNGDGVLGEDGILIAPKFLDKYMNIEHKKTHVVGNLFSYSYAAYGEDTPLTEEEIKETNPVYTVLLGGYVWRVINKKLANFLVEASDPSSPKYGFASLSFELAFKNWDIAIGSKFLNECEIITDAAKKKELEKYLKFKKGPGVYDGQVITRVLRQPLLSLGVGIVRSPAAQVKPLSAYLEEEEENEAREEEASASEEKIQSSPAINVKKPKVSVIVNKKRVMAKIKSKKDLYDLLDSGEEVTASDIRNVIESELTKASEEWEQKVNESKEKYKEVEAKLAELEKSKESAEQASASLKEEKEKLQSRVEDLEGKFEAQAKEQRFTERMGEINEEYDFDDSDRKAIVANVRDLDDEAFASWKDEVLFVLAKEKNKKYKADQAKMEEEKCKKEKEAKEAKASEEDAKKNKKDALNEVVASAQETGDTAPPNSDDHQEDNSLAKRISEAFGDEAYKVL